MKKSFKKPKTFVRDQRKMIKKPKGRVAPELDPELDKALKNLLFCGYQPMQSARKK